MEATAWASKRNDLLIDLLHNMSKFLGYEFSKSEIAKDVYHPTGHVNVETDQEIIRRGFAKVLSGELAIPMAVKEFPADPTAIADQATLQKLIREWLEGKRTVKAEQP